MMNDDCILAVTLNVSLFFFFLFCKMSGSKNQEMMDYSTWQITLDAYLGS